MNLRNKKSILITGVAGFIGFSLTEKLLKKDFFILGIDNLNNYYDVNLKYSRLRKLGIKISMNKNLIKSTKYIIFSLKIRLN